MSSAAPLHPPPTAERSGQRTFVPAEIASVMIPTGRLPSTIGSGPFSCSIIRLGGAMTVAEGSMGGDLGDHDVADIGHGPPLSFRGAHLR